MTEVPRQSYSHAEWLAEARRLFGDEPRDWRFVCPSCGTESSGHDFEAVGADPHGAYQKCIGRAVDGRGCDWAAFGLFDICTVHVEFEDKSVPVFKFAEPVAQHG